MHTLGQEQCTQSHIFSPDFSFTNFKLPDFSRFSRWVAILIGAQSFEQLTGLVHVASCHWVHSLCVRFLCVCFHCMCMHVGIIVTWCGEPGEIQAISNKYWYWFCSINNLTTFVKWYKTQPASEQCFQLNCTTLNQLSCTKWKLNNDH